MDQAFRESFILHFGDTLNSFNQLLSETNSVVAGSWPLQFFYSKHNVWKADVDIWIHQEHVTKFMSFFLKSGYQPFTRIGNKYLNADRLTVNYERFRNTILKIYYSNRTRYPFGNEIRKIVREILNSYDSDIHQGMTVDEILSIFNDQSEVKAEDPIVKQIIEEEFGTRTFVNPEENTLNDMEISQKLGTTFNYNYNPTVQIIVVKNEVDILSAVKSFDLDICQVYYDGESIKKLISSEQIQAKFSNISQVALETQSLFEWFRTFRRIKKYQERGFTVKAPPRLLEYLNLQLENSPNLKIKDSENLEVDREKSAEFIKKFLIKWNEHVSDLNEQKVDPTCGESIHWPTLSYDLATNKLLVNRGSIFDLSPVAGGKKLDFSLEELEKVQSMDKFIAVPDYKYDTCLNDELDDVNIPNDPHTMVICAYNPNSENKLVCSCINAKKLEESFRKQTLFINEGRRSEEPATWWWGISQNLLKKIFSFQKYPRQLAKHKTNRNVILNYLIEGSKLVNELVNEYNSVQRKYGYNYLDVADSNLAQGDGATLETTRQYIAAKYIQKMSDQKMSDQKLDNLITLAEVEATLTIGINAPAQKRMLIKQLESKAKLEVNKHLDTTRMLESHPAVERIAMFFNNPSAAGFIHAFAKSQNFDWGFNHSRETLFRDLKNIPIKDRLAILTTLKWVDVETFKILHDMSPFISLSADFHGEGENKTFNTFDELLGAAEQYLTVKEEYPDKKLDENSLLEIDFNKFFLAVLNPAEFYIQYGPKQLPAVADQIMVYQNYKNRHPGEVKKIAKFLSKKRYYALLIALIEASGNQLTLDHLDEIGYNPDKCFLKYYKRPVNTYRQLLEFMDIMSKVRTWIYQNNFFDHKFYGARMMRALETEIDDLNQMLDIRNPTSEEMGEAIADANLPAKLKAELLDYRMELLEIHAREYPDEEERDRESDQVYDSFMNAVVGYMNGLGRQQTYYRLLTTELNPDNIADLIKQISPKFDSLDNEEIENHVREIFLAFAGLFGKITSHRSTILRRRGEDVNEITIGQEIFQSVFYGCKAGDEHQWSNISEDLSNTYYMLRLNSGLQATVPYLDMIKLFSAYYRGHRKFVVEPDFEVNPDGRKVQKQLNLSISHGVLHGGGMVSADHCQEGSSKLLYRLNLVDEMCT